MIFGISSGELALILVVGAVAFGPKDLPIIARAAGRLTGQAVGYVSALRSRAQTFAEKTQLDELHKELQQTMSQLEAIRYEIRTGANILVPGSMTSRLATRAVKAVTTQASTEGAGSSIKKVAASSVTVESVDGVKVASPDCAETAAPTNNFTTPEANSFDYPPPFDNPRKLQDRAAQIANGVGGIEHAQELLDRRRAEGSASVGNARTHQGGIETLPISAVSAGLLPKRADSASGGADILSDAIIERQISMQAKEFMRSMAKPPDINV